jgi:hypothetical protein
MGVFIPQKATKAKALLDAGNLDGLRKFIKAENTGPGN